MAYHHVIARIGQNDEYRVLFADLSHTDLKKYFIVPYEQDTMFFSGSDLITPSSLRSVQVVQTECTEQEERERINNESLTQIDKFNRESNGLVFIGIGSGYNPEDIAEAGENITHSVIKGPPGFRAQKWSMPVHVLVWGSGIVATVIAARIIKWLGWG